MFRIGDTRLHTGAVPPDREYLVLASLRYAVLHRVSSCPTDVNIASIRGKRYRVELGG